MWLFCSYPGAPWGNQGRGASREPEDRPGEGDEGVVALIRTSTSALQIVRYMPWRVYGSYPVSNSHFLEVIRRVSYATPHAGTVSCLGLVRQADIFVQNCDCCARAMFSQIRSGG